MPEHVYLISGNPEWRDAMAIALEEAGHAEARPESGDPAAWAGSPPPTLVALNADAPAVSVPVGGRLSMIQEIIDDLRAVFSDLPIVLVTSVPSAPLKAAADARGADVVLARDLHGASLVADVLTAANQLRSAAEPAERASWATIEITIDRTTLKCVACSGEHKALFDMLPWSRANMVLLNDSFKIYEDDENEFRNNVKPMWLALTGQRLLNDLFQTPLDAARPFLNRYLRPDGTIYCRVVVGDDDLEFVPFELVATANTGEYLRAVRPVARKLIPKEIHRDPDRELKACRFRCRVLYICSDVSGPISVPRQTFRGQNSLQLRPLPKLKEEEDEIRKLYRQEQLRVLPLRTGQDNIKAIIDAFRDGPFDVVHFAGHSVRADTTNQVFLALPGKETRSVIAYNAEDFAQLAAAADVRLVILSSCQGTSCRALSRMASSGVPAVAGFRWPVDDGDAAAFTPYLHQALRNGGDCVPIILAFHDALVRLKGLTEGRLSWFSPVLMVQRSKWHEFGLQQ